MSTTLISTQGNENWVLSADGAVIFVAGNDGFLRVYDAKSGSEVFSSKLGFNLGALSLAPDGKQLAIVEEVASNVRQSNMWSSNTADVSFYVVDVSSFSAQKYTYTVTGSDYTFADIAWSDGDTLQISQNILPGWSGWAPLSTVELATGARFQSGTYYAGLGSAASLLTIPDSTTVLLGQLGLSSAEYFLIAPTGSQIRSNGPYQNNVQGYAEGIEAASGTTADDRIVIVTGGSAHLYSGTMQYLVDLTDYYPDLGSARGVAFTPDGSRIFFLDQDSQAVVVVDAYTYEVVATVNTPGIVFKTLQLGDEITIVGNGEAFYYNTSQGIAYATVDLPDVGTNGDDTLNGTDGDNVIDGRAGNDLIFGLAGDDWLIGGTGNDSLDGGAGFDFASYETAPTGVTVSLDVTGTQATGGAGTDTLVSIEGLSGSSFNDRLTGNAAANVLAGYDGDDVIYGLGGDDDLLGERGNDSLYGGADIDYLFGGDGNDLLDGGTGADVMEGGNGNDIYLLDDRADVITETATGGNDTMRVTGFDATIFGSVEVLEVTSGAFNATGNFVANTLIGSAENNVLSGLGGNDNLRGGGGNDILNGGAGNDVLDGGTGLDTALYAGTYRTYTHAFTGSARTVAGGREGGTDQLTGIERVQFADGVLTFDPDSRAAQIARLYDTVLQRAPDQVGLEFYLDAMEQGTSLLSIAQGFLASAEFQAATGSLSNAQYVEYLYQNALGRASDAGGRAYWVGQLDSGAQSRADLLVGFSESGEHRQLTAGLVGQGLFETDDAYQAIALLYDSFNQRRPDEQGLVFYGEAVKNGTFTLAQIADQFAGSAEFRAATSGMSNAQIVDFMYLNTLDRLPDAEGRAYYINQLETGAMDLGDVLLDFSQSREHYNLLAPFITRGIAIAGSGSGTSSAASTLR